MYCWSNCLSWLVNVVVNQYGLCFQIGSVVAKTVTSLCYSRFSYFMLYTQQQIAQHVHVGMCEECVYVPYGALGAAF